MDPRDAATLSCSALGSLLGGLLASPLGPWAMLGAGALGTTVGGLLGGQLWSQFYLDMQAKLADARRLLEREQPEAAATLLMSLREHPQYAQQEANFRSELEHVAARVLATLAAKSEAADDRLVALEHFRQASLFQPSNAELLWDSIRLASRGIEPAYEDSGRYETELKRLLALDPRHGGALRALADLFERSGRTADAIDLLGAAARDLTDRPDLAVTAWRAVLRMAPAHFDALARLADHELAEGRPRDAMALLERRASAGADDVEGRSLLGRAAYAAGDFGRARELLEPLSEEFPLARLHAGLAALYAGDARAAEPHLGKLVTHPEHGREATLALCGILLDRGELDVASNHLERDGLAEAPAYELLLKRLATAFEARGLETKAARVFDRMGHLGDSPSFWARFALEVRDGGTVVLGGGSSGRVLLGRRRSDRVPVAIREAATPFAIGGKEAIRFAREVAALGRLSHPNLVALLGHALPEGKCLLAMEYCSGGSLAARLDSALLWADIRAIALSVLDAMAFLAGQEPALIHRNIKPSNILFAAGGAVKLGDFSLARAADASGTSVVSSIQERSRMYLYQSPEAILGSSEVSVASDVYSFGCVLYQMICGRPPFHHPDVDRQIAAHFDEAPAAPSTRAPWVPRALDDLVLRCLEKAPSSRYSDVGGLREALERF